jgi:preprotein translocase subunit SecF
MTSVLEFIGVNKWIQYAILGIVIVSGIAIAFAKSRATGAKLERLNTLEKQLEQSAKEHKIRAEIESASTDIVRQRLRQRWLKR